MYPTISDFINDVFGINIPLPIQTYGFFVALAFITAGYVLSFELKRLENEGLLTTIRKRIKIGEPAKISSLIISALSGFIIGYKLLDVILNYTEFVANPQTFLLSLRGCFIGGFIGAAISAFLTYREKQKEKLETPKWINKDVHPYELSGNMLIIAAIAGLIGTKVFHNLENIDELIKDPMGSIFSFSGLSFYGGLVFGIIAVVIYAKRNKIKLLHLADIVAPIAALGYSIGRIGCQVSGDGCWGIPNTSPKPDWLAWLPDWMWSYSYPNNVVDMGNKMVENCTSSHCHVLDVPVWPTPLYETIIMGFVFVMLWSIRKKINLPGIIASIYLILAGFERFFIEKIRINNTYDFTETIKITQAEIISSISIIIGVVGIILILKYRERYKNY